MARIRYIHVTCSIDSDAEGSVQLAIVAPGQKEHSVRIELLDAVIVRVGYVDMTIAIDSEIRGASEQAVTGTLRAPFGKVLARRIEFLDPMIACIGDKDIACTIDRYTTRAVKLPLFVTKATPLR